MTSQNILLFVVILLSTAMFIGFTQRFQTVSESDGEYNFPINIPVATLRTAERRHPMVFRLLSGGTAIVEPYSGGIYNIFFDALFGSRDGPDAFIWESYDLRRLADTILSRSVDIRNDLRPEDEECFTMRIFPVDVPSRPELFSCNEDDSGATNYFCATTICIEDDDGRCVA